MAEFQHASHRPQSDLESVIYQERTDAPSNEDGNSFNLSTYWNLVRKHRFLILGIVLSTLALGIALTLLMRPIYSASATVQIDREAARVFASETGNAPQESLVAGEEFFQTQYGLLRSRSLSERVIDSLGLASSNEALEALGAAAPVDTSSTEADRAKQRRELAVETLQENLGVSPVRGSRLVNIGYSSPSPEVSARVANAFAENYIQSNLDRKFESSAYAREFLEDRINETRTRLEEAERQLVTYASNQQIINLGGQNEAGEQTGGSLASQSLESFNTALAAATSARVAAEAKWNAARGNNVMTLPEVLQNPAIQRLTEERARLDGEYQQMLRIYQPDYPTMVPLKARIDEIDSQIASIAADIRRSIQNEYNISLTQERALRGRVAGSTAEVLDLADRSVQYNILRREVDTTRSLYENLLQQYRDAGVTGDLTNNNISIVDLAIPPEEPSKPNMLVNLVLALVLGCGLAAVAILVLEALDESLATPEDVEQKLHIPVLGLIPLMETGQTVPEALADVRSPLSEAYYSLRTALQFSTPAGAPSTLLVTSARPGEGKSTTAFATAMNLARTGRRVLLIDGDLRNPSMHRNVGVENDRGMSNLLSGSATIDDVIQRTKTDNLFFIPCGPLPPSPAELWGSDSFTQFLTQALQEFDHIVIDGPPVLGFADAPLLAATASGTLFVLESRSTRRGQARGALQRLRMSRARVLGAAMTKFNVKKASQGGYGYDYVYDYSYGSKANDNRTA